MNPVSRLLQSHYTNAFSTYGPTSQGVDWGSDSDRHELRVSKSLEPIIRISNNSNSPISILDVGCGYGAARHYLAEKGLNVKYAGIDVAPEMIDVAKTSWPHDTWIQGDFLEWNSTHTYDLVICNGILTQKLTATNREMDGYFNQIVRKMMVLSTGSISFNLMSSSANYYAPNLYYRSPGEVLTWCISELSRSVSLDMSYGLHEFWVYVFQENQN